MPKKSRRGRPRSSNQTELAADKTYRVYVDLASGQPMGELDQYSLDLCCMPHTHDEATGRIRMMAFAQGRQVEKMHAAGHRVEVLGDAEAEGKALQKLIGVGDRFKGGKRGPEGIGKLV